MIALYWIVRVLKYWLIAWVLMTWIPGLAGSDLHMLLGLPVIWMLIPFQFLNLGAISLAPIIPLVILGYLERYLALQAGLSLGTNQAPPQQQNYDPSVYVRDMQPAPDPQGQERRPDDNFPTGSHGI